MNELVPLQNNKPVSNLKTKTPPFPLLPLVIISIPLLKKDIFPAFQSIQSKLGINSINDLHHKLHTVRRIGPYLPEPMVNLMEVFIPIYDTIDKSINLMEIVKVKKDNNPIKINTTLSKNKRIEKIIDILDEDFPQSNIKSIYPIIEIAFNIDKYKGLIEGIKTLQDGKKELALEDMIEKFAPLIVGEDTKSISKIKDMAKMAQVLSALDDEDE
ncbi:hypothetical protein [Clostridiisalibacter paucivorans]|uniref:hypothetical protein n=1 Tax=Clostridiisalibacter paucivorans TaxID=408753 RepID=UPI00047AA241|nr:hypothetical protein [Clostridiisalibacter paucivorans]